MCYSVCAGESLSLSWFFFSVWNKYNFMLHHMRSAKCRCSICISFYSPLDSVFFHLAHSILHSYWVIVRHFVKIVPYDESQCRRWILIFERFLTTQRICNVNTFHFFCHPIKYTPNSIPFIFLFLFFFLAKNQCMLKNNKCQNAWISN